MCSAAPQGTSRRAAQRPPPAAPRARSAPGTLRRPPAHPARWPVRRRGCRRQPRSPLPAAAPPCGPPGCMPSAPAQHDTQQAMCLPCGCRASQRAPSNVWRECAAAYQDARRETRSAGRGAMHSAAAQLCVTPTARYSACRTSLGARVACMCLEREKTVCIMVHLEYGQSHCTEKAGDGSAHSLYSVASWLPAPYALSWLHSASCTDARSASSSSSAPACTQPQLCRSTEHTARVTQTCETHIYAHPS